MKIANIIITSQDGGAEQVFLDYAGILKKLGHEVVAVVKQDAPYAHKLLQCGIETKKINNRFGYHDFFAIKKLSKILAQENVDVVFAHSSKATILARKAIKKIKDKKIFLISINHSMNVKRSIGSDLILSVNKQIFYKTIDAGQAAEKSFVIHNATDLQDAILQAPNVDLSQKTEINLGVIGRLDFNKGFHHAINALAELQKISDKKFILKIAGEGKEEKALREHVKSQLLEDKVEFVGWQKDKKKFYESIDILLVPSLNETFGLVVVEGIKYRKPIISSNAHGPREILRDGVDGLFFNVEESDEEIAKEMANIILKIVSETALTTSMIANSFARLNEKFSYEALEKRLAEIVGNISK